MVRLLDWLGIVRGVYLLSYTSEDGYKLISSFVNKKCRPRNMNKAESIFGRPLQVEESNLTACVYPFTRVGHVKLLPNGKIDNHYCIEWRYMHETQ